MTYSKRTISFLYFLIFFVVFSATAEKFDIRAAATIIIVDEGRKKPLQSYARKKLIQISGRRKIDGMNALEWLLKLMFEAEKIDTIECFRISNPETIKALGITGPFKRRYRYTELYTAIDNCKRIVASVSEKKYSELLPYERDVVTLWSNIQEYNALSSAFSAFSPFAGFTLSDSTLASLLRLKMNHAYSLSELIDISPQLSACVKEIDEEDLKTLTPYESQAIHLAKSMYAMGRQLNNTYPRIIRVDNDGKDQWHSIGAYLNNYGRSALRDKRVQSLRRLRAAYLQRDTAEFNDAAKEMTSVEYEDYPYPELEILYNKLNLFFAAKLLYALAGVLVLITLFHTVPALGLWSFVAIILGFILQSTGLILRIFIQMRPPLSSLYETFVFVSWLIVILGIGLELFQKRNIGKIIASLGGFLFLLVSDRYVVHGDTFNVIAAVLNSGFWLTIHIVTISTGYAGFLIAGLLGHIHLLQCMMKKRENPTSSTYGAVYIFLLIGLAFTVAGTVLGGMWADQAWGRFWGWDPKENGALILILWGSAVIHAAKAKIIGAKLTSACAVCGILLVMLTWIGVNLLGVGLHSYGFTYSGAGVLLAVFVSEISFLVASGVSLNVRACKYNKK